MSAPLDVVDGIRKRSGMYVGGSDGRAALELVMSLVGNAFDQHLAGRCTRIAVQLADDAIVVEDDGPGMAGDDATILARFARWTDLPTEDGHRPDVHLSPGPLSLVVPCALSSALELRSVREGVELTARWSRGRIVDAPRRTPTTAANGTRLRLVLDREIFTGSIAPHALLARVDELALLAPSLTITYTLAGTVPSHSLAARVAQTAAVALDRVVSTRVEHVTPEGPITIDLAFTWRSPGDDPVVDSFVNYIRSRGHGAHVDGLLDGIVRVLGSRRAERSRGLVAIVAVVLADVHFGNPTRDQLMTPAARPAVASATAAALRAAIARGVSGPSAASVPSRSPSRRRRR